MFWIIKFCHIPKGTQNHKRKAAEALWQPEVITESDTNTKIIIIYYEHFTDPSNEI